MLSIKRALISVSDKTGLLELAKGLARHGVTLISTGNTAKYLQEGGLEVTKVSEVTGFPEIMDGRVKTLHPRIHGGLLANRAEPAHLAEAKAHGIEMIDLVVVNLYPFSRTISKPEVTLNEAIENIDIGGPAMIRASAKNFQGVAVVVNPERYATLIAEMEAGNGAVSLETRRTFAREAFAHTAAYDQAIVNYLDGDEEAPVFERASVSMTFDRVHTLRYGENPHQRAAVFRGRHATHRGLLDAEKLGGKELSYNNYLDFHAAWGLCREFLDPASVLIKHTNPCGVAMAESLAVSFRQAYACDSVSAFGGVFAFNREIDEETARAIHAIGFFEGIVAPGYSEKALKVLRQREGRMLLRLPEADFFAPAPIWSHLPIPGGLLVQDTDTAPETPESWKAVTKRQPTGEEAASLAFAWTVAKHVKSNAIVLTKGTATMGIGAGQMSRVDSSHIAARKAGDRGPGSVMASDAFFPFRDGLDAAHEVGVTAVIQPGGSVRDEEVIAAADEHNMAMIFTGRRHFKH